MAFAAAVAALAGTAVLPAPAQAQAGYVLSARDLGVSQSGKALGLGGAVYRLARRRRTRFTA